MTGTPAKSVGRPPERIRVTIRRRRSGESPIDHDLLWPKGWSLPQQGDIVTGGPLAGWVERIEYDTDASRILIVLRP